MTLVQNPNAHTLERIETPQEAAVARLAEWANAADAAHRIAETLVQTSFCPDSFKHKAGEATAAILAGLEVGLQPMASLRSFDIIQGQAAPRAVTLRAIVQAGGHEVELVESTATRCKMRGKRRGSTDWQTITWTIDRARDLGVTGKSNWRSQPQAMLVARATSEICRLVASDAILGMGGYSVEEVADDGRVDQLPAEVTTPVANGTRRLTRKRADAPGSATMTSPTGGFPCQDVSHAGKRAGLRPDTRTGLWSQMAYAIDQLRPALVVAENVRGLLSAEAHSDLEPCPWCMGDGEGLSPLRALGAVLGDLADLGYDAAGTAYALPTSAPRTDGSASSSLPTPSAPAPTQTSSKGNPQLAPAFVEWMMGLPAGWVTDTPGITRNEALKALGNGVVPLQAEAALRLLLDVLAAVA
jgi:hypothetical protein